MTNSGTTSFGMKAKVPVEEIIIGLLQKANCINPIQAARAKTWDEAVIGLQRARAHETVIAARVLDRLESMRMWLKLSGVRPEELAQSLYKSGYPAREAAPAILRYFPELDALMMLNLLHTTYVDPVLSRDEARSALQACGYAGQEIDSALQKVFEPLAYALDIKGGAFMAAASHSAYNFGVGDFTLEAWIRPASAGTILSRKSTGGGRGQGGFLLVLKPDGSFKLATDNGFGFYEINSVPTRIFDREWHHISALRQKGQLRFYLDGDPLESSVRKNAETPLDVNNSLKLLLGSADQTQEPYIHYSGLMDEVRVWRSALSQDDIRRGMYSRLSGNEPGLVGYWVFDNMSATDKSQTHNDAQPQGQVGYFSPGALKDLAGLIAYYPLKENARDYRGGKDGSPSAAVEYSSGPFGRAASFTKSGANIQLPFFQRYANNYTLSAWVYLQDYRNIDPQNAIIGSIAGRLSARHSDGNLFMFFYYDTEKSADNQLITLNSVSGLPLREWQRVMVTYDHTSRQLKIYLNGRLDAVHDLSSRISARDRPHMPAFRAIGGCPGTSYDYDSTLNGLVSEVRFWAVTRE